MIDKRIVLPRKRVDLSAVAAVSIINEGNSAHCFQLIGGGVADPLVSLFWWLLGGVSHSCRVRQPFRIHCPR